MDPQSPVTLDGRFGLGETNWSRALPRASVYTSPFTIGLRWTAMDRSDSSQRRDIADLSRRPQAVPARDHAIVPRPDVS